MYRLYRLEKYFEGERVIAALIGAAGDVGLTAVVENVISEKRKLTPYGLKEEEVPTGKKVVLRKRREVGFRGRRLFGVDIKVAEIKGDVVGSLREGKRLDWIGVSPTGFFGEGSLKEYLDKVSERLYAKDIQGAQEALRDVGQRAQ